MTLYDLDNTMALPSFARGAIKATTPMMGPQVANNASKMDAQQFGQRIKIKYPEYADMPDEELGQKMLTKYPEYADIADVPPRPVAPVATKQPQQEQTFLQKAGSVLKGRGKAVLENVKSFEKSRAEAVAKEGVKGGIKKAFQVPREAVQVLGDVAGVGGDLLGLGMMEVIDMLPGFIKEGAKDIGRSLLEKPIVQAGVQQLMQGMDKYQTRAKENPETAKTIESVYNIAELPLNFAGGKVATKGAIETAKIAGKGVQKTGRGIAEIGAAGLGLTTGTSPDTIKTALKYGYKPEFKAALRGNLDETDVLKSVQEAAGRMKMSNSQLYGKAYEKIVNSTAQIDPKGAAQPVFDLLQSPTGYAVKANTDDAGRIVLDFSTSKIGKNSPQQKIIQDIVDEIQDWKDTSPLGMDILRKRIDDYYVGTPDYAKSDAIVTNLRNEIGDRIVKEIPEYAEMNAKYSEISNLMRDIKGALSLGNKAQTTTAITKLKGALRRNQEFRQAMLKELQTFADTDILATLAGTELNQRMPRGLAGVAAGVAGFMNPQLLAGLAASSPRVIGELAGAIGTTKKIVGDAVKKAAAVVSNAKDKNPLSGTPLNDLPFDLSTAVGNYSNSVKE